MPIVKGGFFCNCVQSFFSFAFAHQLLSCGVESMHTNGRIYCAPVVAILFGRVNRERGKKNESNPWTCGGHKG